MLDPLPPPPGWLRDAVDPWAIYYNVPALSDHIHEVLFSFVAYGLIHFVLSPLLSPILFPRHYPKLNRRTKLNWDVHVVSLVQSTFINALALWAMFSDEERKSMNIGERIYGYSGVCAMVQAFAAGYFVYDLIVSLIYVRMFGIGMLFHAVSALWVFSFGYRPFVNFYSPVFILYELSSPFLNIHWFLDKLNMTGSNLQWYNGMMLLFMFFSCRLVWGTWQSVLVYRDMWYALKQTWDTSSSSPGFPVDISSQVFGLRDPTAHCHELDEVCRSAGAEISRYASHTAGGIPTWLVLTYVVSNVVLNSLNYYWFSKMIETVMKRFRGPANPAQPPPAAKNEEEKTAQLTDDIAQKVVLDAAAKLEQEEGSLFHGDEINEKIASAVDTGITDELRRRKADVASAS
ncbi:TLC domain-containing protein [Aspergillus melleus]|uniref:TLC domain-containing protein n=1 Tax=Aspergillus melleus TaxID=138277 RepID=UPI001E8E97CA|nr:uncharacterized protein LDX57_000592 [Aspergillus melleus]KAH8422837.1 hypothetical protein LDX57_000592 [Aspergillus melleus]